ncbi:MAG: hypothetical protein AMXMBFR6_19130 [Betaproteobacteria bacterium]
MRQLTLLASLTVLAWLPVPPAQAAAGPFAPAAGQPGSTAIGKDDSAFTGWATGYRDYVIGAGVDSGFQTPQLALGKAAGNSYDIVSLGEGGRITLTFAGALFNGPGADFAVFENAFNDNFLELARVDVSSDGLTFVRFPAYSFTPGPVGGFGSIDPTNIDGLAGKYRQGHGTPFDLGLLAGSPGLDVDHVRYVRIVDVVGDGSAFDDFPAAYGGPFPIYDPYPSTGSAGFDLDAVGAIHFAAATVPEPAAWVMLASGIACLGALGRRRSRRLAPSALV